MQILNIADLTNRETGKTFREENEAKQHSIPIGTLVELVGDPDSGTNGVRLYVVGHVRDCDGTPLYRIGMKGAAITQSWRPGFYSPDTFGNYAESSLSVVTG